MCAGALKSHMSSKKHSNGAGQSSRGSASKRRMHLTSYLWKKIGMLWKNYGKAMEFLFWGSVRTLSKEGDSGIANFFSFVSQINDKIILMVIRDALVSFEVAF